MIFNKRVRIGFIRTSGTKRLHHFKYQRDGETGYELGVNIIPRRLGCLVYIWITDIQELLKKKLERKEQLIDDLKETIGMILWNEEKTISREQLVKSDLSFEFYKRTGIR